MSKGPQWWVKIADFGISKRAVEGLTALRTLVGTPAFAAPEVLGYGCGSMNDRHGDPYTHAVDIWSTGVITFWLLTGETYFKDQRRLCQYATGNIVFPSNALHTRSISDLGCDFTEKQALQHPWLINMDRTVTCAPPGYCFHEWCTYLRLLTRSIVQVISLVDLQAHFCYHNRRLWLDGPHKIQG
jgi:serine/threonine protein kinase